MRHGFRIFDTDSHAMEPDDLWARYMDRRYAAFMPTTRRISPDWPYFVEIEVAGNAYKGGQRMDQVKFVTNPTGGERLAVTEAYAHWIERGFSAASYLDYMDAAGIDHMLIYPTIGLPITAQPNLDARVAAAIKAAYNSWLSDWCAGGQGRIHGVGSVDLRDVELAVKEARRCVNDLGLRSVYVLPDPPIEGMPLDHPRYDELWAEVAALGVPLGTHECIPHRIGNVGHVGARHLTGSALSYGGLAASFGLGEMMGAMLFCGSVLPRHPELKVVFTESSVGWCATWLPFLDEKWEAMSIRGYAVAEHPPSHYFREQCYISGDGGDRGFYYAVDAGFERCLLAASDFPHPESPDFPHAIDKFFDRDASRLSDESLRRILWENAAALYGLEP